MHREERKMSQIRHDFNISFDVLLSDIDHGRVSSGLSQAMTRPAYQHTSLEQKKIFQESECDHCGYYKMGINQKCCQFPWYNPSEYDLVLIDYLPCKEADHEKNR